MIEREERKGVRGRRREMRGRKISRTKGKVFIYMHIVMIFTI